MKYAVKLEEGAARELGRLPAETVRRITESLLRLEENPRSRRARRLVLADGYRLRIGDYRVLFTVNDEAGEVRVYRIRHRREAYR